MDCLIMYHNILIKISKKMIIIFLISTFICVPTYAQQVIKRHHNTKKLHRVITSKKNHKRSRQIIVKKKIIPNDRTALVKANLIPTKTAPPGFMASIGEKLVSFVHSTVSTLRYSAYKLGGTHFDKSKGIYIVDCSDYIDRILKEVYPDAYFDLVKSTGAEKPTTQHYFDFFQELAVDDPNDYWNKVEDVEKLEPGDIIVFRYKSSYTRPSGGHVMVVMDKPIRDEDSYVVRVADSAPSGHSEDTRPGKVSGIGIGSLVLKANASGQPSAYAWKIGSRWEKNVKIAMGRPVNLSNQYQ